MKRLIVFICLLISIPTFGQKGSIRGKLIYKLDSSVIQGGTVWIINTKRGAITDANGLFKIDSLAFGSYDIVTSFLGLGQDTIRSIVVKRDSITTLSLGLPSGDCSSDKAKECPIGNKKDMVIPIVYGLPGKKLRRKSDKGKAYLGGCIVTGCDPEWYCKRHKIKF